MTSNETLLMTTW